MQLTSGIIFWFERGVNFHSIYHTPVKLLNGITWIDSQMCITVSVHIGVISRN
ncbi:hypothetical protein SAMN02927897_03021 [Kosakonia sacchari]|uniref:Uncharacterized protein n=1 Tax=Kosakonia sacchari TaxID=1158459 RepID=A0A1G4YMG3_9ENTR|nr:hypothetical protein SAMN02927897_03021 [Kosakonia sacchari]